MPPSLANPRTLHCSNFRKAARSVTQLFDQILAPAGLRSTQLVILITCQLLGPSSIARLAHELVMDRSTLTRNLKPLLALGLLKFSKSDAGKHKSVELTAEGRAALYRACPIGNKPKRTWFRNLATGAGTRSPPTWPRSSTPRAPARSNRLRLSTSPTGPPHVVAPPFHGAPPPAAAKRVGWILDGVFSHLVAQRSSATSMPSSLATASA